MRKITVAMLLFPRFQLLDIAGPRDAFAEVKVLSKGEIEFEMITIGTMRRCGFDHVDSLRRSFYRRLKINPVDYRGRFWSNPVANAEPTHSRTLRSTVEGPA
jgi:hypothetical protein